MRELFEHDPQNHYSANDWNNGENNKGVQKEEGRRW